MTERLTERQRAVSLLRRCHALLGLSGMANAAQAGFLTGMGIANLDELQQLRQELAEAIARSEPRRTS